METTKQDTPYKIRSARACIVAGFQQYTGNFRRIFKVTWLPSLVFALVSGVAESLLVEYYPLVVLALLIVYCLLYRFWLRKRLSGILEKVKGTMKNYLRHFGQIAAVAFATFIFCVAIWLLTSVPAVILGIANIEAQNGVLYGDPLGMPDYMKWLTIGVFALASFLQAYIYLLFFFPLRYAQGSAVAAEDERAQAVSNNLLSE